MFGKELSNLEAVMKKKERFRVSDRGVGNHKHLSENLRVVLTIMSLFKIVKTIQK